MFFIDKKEQTLRLRLKLISIKEMNPFALDLSTPREVGFVRNGLAKVTRVPPENIRCCCCCSSSSSSGGGGGCCCCC